VSATDSAATLSTWRSTSVLILRLVVAYNAVTEYVVHSSKVRGGDDQSARALRAVTIGSTAQAMKANAFRILQTL